MQTIYRDLYGLIRSKNWILSCGHLLPTWDGVYFFDLSDWAPVPDLLVSTDASGSRGYGAFYACEWSAIQQPLSIAYKELLPIVITCHVWGSRWRNRRIHFCCDNQSVVAVISSGTAKDTRLMQLLRELFLCAARFKFIVIIIIMIIIYSFK